MISAFVLSVTVASTYASIHNSSFSAQKEHITARTPNLAEMLLHDASANCHHTPSVWMAPPAAFAAKS